MLRSSIFVDEERLSPRYIPKTLPHREEQLKLLTGLFHSSLDNPSNAYLKIVQITGDAGTGKTCTTLNFSKQVQEQATRLKLSFRPIYSNLKLEGGSRFTLYSTLLEKAVPEIATRSLSPEEMLRELLKFLRKEKRYLLLILDEIDYQVKRTKDHILYDLTRLNEYFPGEPSNILGVILIARNSNWRNQLESAELSTLGRNQIHFTPYTSTQIQTILEQRAELAFRRSAVSTEVIEYIADVTSRPPVNSDVRYALDLLLYAGKLAEQQGTERIEIENVRRVHGEIWHTVTTEDILNLPETEKHILLALANALKQKDASYVNLKEIREAYTLLAEEYGIKPSPDMEELVQDLGDREIIDIRGLTQIGISGVPTETLTSYLDTLIDRVRDGIKTH